MSSVTSAQNPNMNSSNQMNKKLGVLPGISIATMMLVGSGIFALPGLVIETSGPITSLFSWIFVTAISIPIICVFSTLGSLYPGNAGIARYADIAIGPQAKTITMLISYGAYATGMPALFLVAASYLTHLFNWQSDLSIYLLSIILLLFVSIINLLGIKIFLFLNLFISSLTIISLLFFIIINIPVSITIFPTLLIELEAQSFIISDIWISAAMIFWAYQGLESLSFSTGEFTNPKKTIPKIFWGSFSITAILYILLAWVSTSLFLSGYNITGFSGLSEVFDQGICKFLFVITIVCLLFANACTWFYSTSRLTLSLSQEKILPCYFSKLSKMNQPYVAITSNCIVYALVLTISYLFSIPEKYLFLLTTQNFIILYGVSIYAYLKQKLTIAGYIISFCACLSWVFLISGFSWMILFPISLSIFGLIFHYSRLKDC